MPDDIDRIPFESLELAYSLGHPLIKRNAATYRQDGDRVSADTD